MNVCKLYIENIKTISLVRESISNYSSPEIIIKKEIINNNGKVR